LKGIACVQLSLSIAFLQGITLKEKRKHFRANLIYYLKVSDVNSQEPIGHLVDISLGGIKLLTDKEIDVNKDYHLSISLPEGLTGKSLQIKAKSLWSKQDVNPNFNASGFVFTELQKEAHEIIEMLIRSYRLENNVPLYSN
jgi:hypothetical protein